MTNVVVLLGSPRANGNSDILAKKFCELAEERGAHARCHALRDLQFGGYAADDTDSAPYGQDDDLAPVLAEVEQADVVVLATPIYFCDMTGLLKQAFDRFFHFLKPDYVTNPDPSRLGRDKVLVLVQVQGEGPERYGELLGQYAPALDKLGFVRRELLRASGVRAPGDVLAEADVLKQAEALADALFVAGG